MFSMPEASNYADATRLTFNFPNYSDTSDSAIWLINMFVFFVLEIKTVNKMKIAGKNKQDIWLVLRTACRNVHNLIVFQTKHIN